MYVEVSNGQIVKKHRELPQEYTYADGRKIGNFNLLPQSEIEAEGFYKINDVIPTYDNRIERVVPGTLVFNGTSATQNYVKESIPLDVLKHNKLTAIGNYSKQLLYSSLFQYNNAIYELSTTSTSNASELYVFSTLATFPSNFSWTDADGNEVAMTQTQFNNFVIALGTQKLNIIGVSKYHSAAVSALTDPLLVFNYDFSTGWNNYIRPVPEGDII